jgi:hypothetical protein
MKVKMFFTIIAGCMLLLAASCEKDPPPNLGTNDPPTNPIDTTGVVITTPHDSVLPPYIEKWIWVRYFRNDGCGPFTETFSPPENFFGADTRAITIDWRDSSYISQSCRNAATNKIVSEISGTFSCRDTIIMLGEPFGCTKVIFSNGITMGPLEITEWLWPPFNTFSWTPAYVEEYQVPNQFVYLVTKEHKGQYEFSLHFLRITSQNYAQNYQNSNKNKIITFNQKTNKKQINQPNYQSFKNYKLWKRNC